MRRHLVSEELPERVARGRFPGILRGGCDVGPAGELEVFAVISKVLFGHGLGAPIAALAGGPNVVTGAVQANTQI
jgi:hypothetical protein